MFRRNPKPLPAQPPPPRTGRGGGFSASTTIARATGSGGRYSCDAVHAFPAAHRGQVVLQATDGHQAACVVTKGKLSDSHLVPSQVLPTRQLKAPAAIRLVDGQWASTEDKSADERPPGENPFPPIGEVLPQVGKRPAYATAAQACKRGAEGQGESTYVVLGIDLDVLRRTAGALGTSKLTLFVPLPVKGPQSPSSETFVNKPIAVCPASDDMGEQGIGVVMPLKPANTSAYYEKVRQLVIASEKKAAKRSKRRRAAAAPA